MGFDTSVAHCIAIGDISICGEAAEPHVRTGAVDRCRQIVIHGRWLRDGSPRFKLVKIVYPTGALIPCTHLVSETRKNSCPIVTDCHVHRMTNNRLSLTATVHLGR